MIKKRTLICFIALLFVAGELLAQAVQKPNDLLRNFALSIPFDGGMFLVMAVGMVYGGTVLSKD
jgi:hypothetical protein